MAIITVARELGSVFESEVKSISEALQAHVIHKELLEKRFQEAGADPRTLERYDEKKPGFFSSFFNNEQDVYLQTLKMVLVKEISKGQHLVIGRGGNYLLRNLPNCLKLRFVAPLEVRIRRLAENRGISEQEARKAIESSDTHRAGFCRFHYDMDWRDSTQYDLVINVTNLTTDEITAMAVQALAFFQLPEKETAGAELLKDMLLEEEIIRQVIFVEKLPIQFFDAKCKQGEATISGIVNSPSVAAKAARLAASVEGVHGVTNGIQTVDSTLARRM